MANGSRTTYRYRLSVPDRDTSVREWIAAQDHLSMSLRLLIKEDIQRNGLVDVTCRMIENGVSGGTRKQGGRQRPEAYEHSQRATKRFVPPVPDGADEDAVRGDEPEDARAGAARGEAPVPKAEPVRRTERPAAGTGNEAKRAAKQESPSGDRTEERKPAPKAEPVREQAGDPADPMAFLSQTAGNAGGMMGMLGLDDDEDGSES